MNVKIDKIVFVTNTVGITMVKSNVHYMTMYLFLMCGKVDCNASLECAMYCNRSHIMV